MDLVKAVEHIPFLEIAYGQCNILMGFYLEIDGRSTVCLIDRAIARMQIMASWST